MPLKNLLPVLTLCLVLAGPCLFGAQTSAPVTVKPVVANPITAQAFKAAIIASKALFKSGNFTEGEATLFAVNHNPDGTPEGFRDSGAALISQACSFRQDGDGVTSVKLARLALVQLGLAQTAAAGNAKLAANVDALIGFIHEHLYGTRQQAEASYAAAVRLSPKTSQIALVALSRLQAADNFMALRAKKASGN